MTSRIHLFVKAAAVAAVLVLPALAPAARADATDAGGNDACRVLRDAGVSQFVGGPGTFQFTSEFKRNGATVWQCIYIPDSDPDKTPDQAASLTLAQAPRGRTARQVRAGLQRMLRAGGYQRVNVGDLAGFRDGPDGPAAVWMAVGRNVALVAGPHVLELSRAIARELRRSH